MNNTYSDNYKRKSYNVAIYCRLSNDDGVNTISNSIENQKKMLKEYAIQNKWNVYDYYVDDGYTGTNFERPGFKRLLRDIENGYIYIVITKDMSRLGRDYIQVGFYIEKYFPEAGVRYIAVNDCVDTQEDSNNELTPFKAVINDMYSKDISKKIRSVFELKRREGKFIGSFAPYGYNKDPEDKNKLIIDEETSWIVKKIFDLYLSGNGLKNIANHLNEENIPPPAAYKSKKIKKYNPARMKIPKWCHSAVKHILTNRTYTGDLAQGKAKKINYKSQKIKRVHKKDWIIIENTHEPIVSREEFKLVQDLMDKRNTNFGWSKKGARLFSGFAFCGDCGGYMTYHKMPKGYYFLICSTYKKYGKKECERHAILEEKLEMMILEDFKKLADKFANQEKLTQQATEIIQSGKENNRPYKEELKLAENRLGEIRSFLKALYEDKVKGLIDEEQLKSLYHEFKHEKTGLLKRREELLEKIEGKKEGNIDKQVEKLIHEVLNLKHLNRLILTQLVDKIEVFQDQNIKIYYKVKKL